MANVRNGNTFFIDTASSGGTASSYISEKQSKVAHIIFNSNAIGDSVVLADLDPTTGNSAGSTKIEVRRGTADDNRSIDLSGANAVFPNGIWVVSISAGASATLILSSRGG